MGVEVCTLARLVFSGRELSAWLAAMICGLFILMYFVHRGQFHDQGLLTILCCSAFQTSRLAVRSKGWVCVCLCLWNIWIDVKLLHSRGHERHGKSPANEDTYHRRWYQTWPVWRTCIVVITCCSGFASIQFLVSGDGKRLHPRTSKSFLQFSALLSQSVKMGTIWRSVNFQLISPSSGYGDGSFVILSRVFSPTHSCQV